MTISPRRSLAVLAAIGLLALTMVACAAGGQKAIKTGEAAPTTAPAQARPLDKQPSSSPVAPMPAGMVAEAKGSKIDALDGPSGKPVATFKNPNANDVQLVFLVDQRVGDWIKVRLPMRPNGTMGWIRATDVDVKSLPYRVEISTAAKTLTVFRDAEVIGTYPAAIGTGDTPTPLGTFFITELFEPTNSGYGPFAYGLSGYSEVLNSFGGGPGQIGIHGTDDKASIGRAASHGCVRLDNAAITFLAKTLPLGTPVVIT